MTWFAAHALIAIRRIDSVGPISIYENVLLLEADSSEQAKALAAKLTEAEVAIDDGLTINGVVAVRKFAGVRKVISVSNPDPLDLDKDRPVSGTEITYSEYEVESEAVLQRLAAGEAVDVRYVD